MAIEFDCPACGATIRVGDNAVGKKGRCPKCQVLLLVPDPDDFEEGDESAESADTTAEPEPDPEPSPEPSPDPEPDFEAPPVFTGTPAAATAQHPPATSEPAPEPIPDLARPVPFDPDNPFAFAAGPTDSPRVAAYRHRGRSASGLSPRTKITAAAAVLGLAIVLLGGWLLYRFVSPDLTGSLTGERFRDVELPSVSFAAPGKDVPAETTSEVMDVLENEGLPIKSEYISVLLDGNNGRPRVTVSPGPRAIAVRVPLGGHTGVQATLVRVREPITELKQAELRTATANLFRDYAAYLDGGSAMAKLLEYRNQVALNAATGPVGYAVEAVVSGVPFPCVYEDAQGHCYFFLPEGISTFQLRGRKLPDGSTPLPVEFEVTLVDARSPVVSEAKPSKTSDADAKPDDKADDKSEQPKDESKPEAMKEASADKPGGDSPESSDGK